jgi:hypothetical protein
MFGSNVDGSGKIRYKIDKIFKNLNEMMMANLELMRTLNIQLLTIPH